MAEATSTTAPPPVPPNGGSPAEEPKGDKPKKTNAPRDYGLFKKIVISRETPGDDVVEAIKSVVPDDDSPFYVLVRVGTTTTTTARRAIEVIGSEQDLSGNYEVITDGARTEFKNVSSAVKRTITIG